MLNLTPADSDNKKIPALLRANFGKPGGAELRSYIKQQRPGLFSSQGIPRKKLPAVLYASRAAKEQTPCIFGGFFVFTAAVWSRHGINLIQGSGGNV
jgi:hypothetical protein